MGVFYMMNHVPPCHNGGTWVFHVVSNKKGVGNVFYFFTS